eukprot:CAMPEP_0202687876 /NCGR_PEP_ID=MMETSP1385-20130828/3449_1 /ASSEMBLY_ACC=CAM_ASM_000861 /TAXON_ID=933848 /ORGANISM="Elphidium margaritaceum" /LENGTH=955 /DNA_ID=CAMNT_0049342729 /DNA_START=1830 /DNA_END=4697 /DNA_ORIENTATION=+
MFLNKEQQAQVREHLTKVLHEFSDADSIILSDYIVALLAKEGTEVQVRNDCMSELSAFMNEKTEQFVEQLFEFINKNIKRGRTAQHNGKSITITTSSSEPPSTSGVADDKGNLSVVIRHKRNVEVQNKPATAAPTEDTEPEPQQDFAVSNTPSPPNVQRNEQNQNEQQTRAAINNNNVVASTVSPSHAGTGTATVVRPQTGAYPNQSYYRNRQAHTRRNVHPTRFMNGHGNGGAMPPGNKDNTNLQTLNQLLSIVQQNIQHVQQQQLPHPNKAAFTTNRPMPMQMQMQMQPGLSPTIINAPYVARPILQHTPNIIPTGARAPSRPPSHAPKHHPRASRPAAAPPAAVAPSQPPPPRMPLPQQRLDEVRLPPNSNPFYQDNRFNGARQQHVGNVVPHNHHNRMVGTKRNFSKMNSRDNISGGGGNKKDGGTGKKFETAQHEKRQLYVYNIPSHLNTMSRLTSHFQQFGDIQNIQVHRDSNRAYVQFATHDEALEALNYPDVILGETAIQTAWAYYNRPDFERNAAKSSSGGGGQSEHNRPHQHLHQHQHDQSNSSGTNDEQQQQQHASSSSSHSYSHSRSESHTPSESGVMPHRAVNHQWVSAEYRQKMSSATGTPPTKKQKVGDDGGSSVIEEKSEPIPKDVSDNIEQLKNRLSETMKMFEILVVNNSSSNKATDDDKDAAETANDKKELQNNLKQTIENIESQLKKLIAHQKKRNEMLAKQKAKKSKAAATMANRGRGRGKPFGYFSKQRRPFSTYAPNPMMMMRGGGMYSWRGRGGAKYRAITRKSRMPKKYPLSGAGAKNKIDFSGKSIDFRSSSLIIGGLPSKVDEAELRRHFLCFAEVDSIDLFSHANLAVIKFKKRSDAEKALFKGKSFKSSANESCELKLRFIEQEELNQLINKRKNSKNNEKQSNVPDESICVASERNGDDHNESNGTTTDKQQDAGMYNDLNTEQK